MTPYTDFIRQKAIEANPNRKEPWEHDDGRPETNGYLTVNPCRFADIILAFPEHKKPNIVFSSGMAYWGTPSSNRPFFNLRQDDINLQPLPTQKFVAELLGYTGI